MIPAIIITAILLVLFGAMRYNTRSRTQQDTLPDNLKTSNVTHERLTEMEDKIHDLPNKVLESINGSISNQKGKLAELIAYVSLKAGYDKVIPLGNIVDFIGIRFPTEDDPGTFDFIDVKNGKSARLSEDQKQLQKLIQTHNIKFLKIKVTTDNVTDIPISGADSEV